MKDSKGKRRPETPDEAPGDKPMASYTPEQRRIIHKGLRIWARVAIRSYVNRHGAQGELPVTSDDSQNDEESSR